MRRDKERQSCQHRVLGHSASQQDGDARPVWVVCRLACPRGPTHLKRATQ
jgi:hypothetical protein